MKLNYKRTFLIGLAFMSICAFWQMYDNVIPLILKKTFGLDSVVSGAIMAADNVCALFLLPLFGSISDKTSTRFGRRMPFILSQMSDLHYLPDLGRLHTDTHQKQSFMSCTQLYWM